MSATQPIITTQRLSLREWSPSDRPALDRIGTEPEIVRWLHAGEPFSAAELDRFIERRVADQAAFGWSRWAVELRHPAPTDPTGIVGFCGFGSQIAPEPELGWTLLPALWGRGLATEAATAALAYGFEVARMPAVISAILAANTRSRAVAERIGMRLEGTLVLEGLEHLRYLAQNPQGDPT